MDSQPTSAPADDPTRRETGGPLGVNGSEVQQTRRHGHLIWIFVGLALAVFISALDETIVATAAVTITSEFRSFDLYPFVALTYLVAVNAAQPVYATLSDTFGRKAPIMIGVSIFFVGSVGCGWAQNMPMFLACRAVAGLGAGGLVSLAFIVIADIFPNEERGKYQGVLNTGFSLATVMGPILGGVFTEEVTWRWCFWINLPVIAITMTIMVFLFKQPRPDVKIAEGLRKVDWLGSLLLAATSACFLVPLSLGGDYWSWKAPQVIILFIVSALALAAFYVVERRRGPLAMVPLRLFRNRGLVAAWISLFFYSTVFITYFYYLAVWFQVVGGKKPAIVAAEFVPIFVGTSVAGLAYAPLEALSSRLLPAVPSTRTLSLIGVVLFVLGAALRAAVTQSTPTAAQVVELLIFGLGAGLTVQSCFMAAQGAVPPDDLAMASSLATLAINMGDAVGLAVSGAVNRVTLAQHFGRIPADVASPDVLGRVAFDPTLVYAPGVLTSQARPLVIDAFAESVMLTFRVAVAFAGITLVAVFCVRHPLVTTPARTDNVPDPVEMRDVEKHDEAVRDSQHPASTAIPVTA